MSLRYPPNTRPIVKLHSHSEKKGITKRRGREREATKKRTVEPNKVNGGTKCRYQIPNSEFRMEGSINIITQDLT